MKQILKYAGYVLAVAAFGYMVWRFSYMIAWILAAAVLSFVGIPWCTSSTVSVSAS